MCVRFVKEGKRIVGLKLDFKTIMVTIGGITAIMVFWTLLSTQINGCTATAREKLVRPKAVEIFKEYHAPYEATLDTLKCQNKKMICQYGILVEMMKLANADKPWLYKQAKSNIDNPPGRFQEEQE
jgi:hypothetical protein